MMGKMLTNYKRLAPVNTGRYELEHYCAYARSTAERLGLRYKELPGSKALLYGLLHGRCDGDFVVLRPRETISLLELRSARKRIWAWGRDVG